MKKLYIIIAFGSIIGVSWLLSRNVQMNEEIKPKPASGITKNITIWIHGTRGAAFLPVGITQNTAQVEKNICSAPAGLHLASTVDPKFHNHTISNILATADKEQFPRKHFYSFGWSGDLNPAARKKAAQELHDQLAQLVLNYVVRYAAVPHITLITHSHGGNVALNLATVAGNESPLSINRLMLLACPVQQETALFADAPIFKLVYAIHSHNDSIQILDPQGLHPIKEGIKESWSTTSLKPLAESAKESSKIPLFSERHFASARVKHVSVSWKNKAPWSEEDLAVFGPLAGTVKTWSKIDGSPRGLMHVEFLLPSFLSNLTQIIHYASSTRTEINDIVEIEVALPL